MLKLQTLKTVGLMLSVALQEAHANGADNGTKTYSVTVRNNYSERLYIHNLVTHGWLETEDQTLRYLPRNEYGVAYPVYTFPIESGESADVGFFYRSTGGGSHWTMFWDTVEVVAHGPMNQTLFEAFCQVSDDSSKQTCWTDVSNVDALTSNAFVSYSGECCGERETPVPINVTVPDHWQCPMGNRFEKEIASGAPQPLLHQSQACLSNCSVLQTDLACCKGKYNTPDTCANTNPDLVLAAPEAYTYAYDDYGLGRDTPSPLRKNHFCLGRKILDITVG